MSGVQPDESTASGSKVREGVASRIARIIGMLVVVHAQWRGRRSSSSGFRVSWGWVVRRWLRTWVCWRRAAVWRG